MIYPIRKIVAAIGRLEESDPVLVAAVDAAERSGAELHLVHTFELPNLMWDASARMGMMPSDVIEGYAARCQRRLRSAVGALTSSERVHLEVAAAPPAPTVVECANRTAADLIIIGACQHGAIARALLGTTAQRVLRNTPVPVLVLRKPLPRHLARVLLTTDLTDFSAGIHEAGLDVLETLFDGDEPQLRSLYVYSTAGDPSLIGFPATVDKIAGEALSAFLRQRRARSRPVEEAVRFGGPAREIINESEAWQPDLLVVGTHARKAPKRWLLGSVAEASIRDSPTSVLVIPAAIQAQRSLPVAVTESAAATPPAP